MKRIPFAVSSAVLLLAVWPARSLAQQTPATANATGATQVAPPMPVPHLVKFSGRVKDLNGKPLTGIAGVTFALYQEDQGGAPLWLETQNVQLDSNGRYSVMLGITKPDGLPADLFTSGEARWLGAQPAGQAEPPRVLLVSVPYALKAGDAETLGGKHASAFLQALSQGNESSGRTSSGSPAATSPTVHGSGTLNFLPLWTGSSLIGNSTLFEKSGNLGVGTTTPATTLDVNGAATIRGNASITGTLSASTSLTAPSAGFTGNNTSQILRVNQGGAGAGVYATSASVTGSSAALQGVATATSGSGRGVIGTSYSNTGEGVLGIAGSFGGTGTSTGVYGISTTSAGTGVSGSGSIGVLGSGFVVGGLFQASGSALILKGLNSSGTSVFSVNGSGSLSAAGNLFTAGTLSAGAGASIGGNGLATFIGDPGCGGSGTTAVGFSNSGLSNCSNYALRGDTGGNLYINSSSTGWMFFDHNNSGSMSLDPSGNLDVQGNASQARGAGGLVKAMAYIDPFVPGGIAVVSCYNSQMSGAAVNTPPCGITLSNHGQGSNVIDFGFQVSDRFIQITPQVAAGTFGQKSTRSIGAYLCSPNATGFRPCITLNPNQTQAYTFDATDNSPANGLDVPIFILVF